MKSLLVLAGLFVLQAAASGLEVKTFDTQPKDGMIDQAELSRLFTHRAIEKKGLTFADLDKNRDLSVSADEIEPISILAQEDLQEFVRSMGGPAPYKIDDVTRGLKIGPKPAALWGYLRVRETADLPLESSFAKAKPAKITFARDLDGDKDSWVAKGAVIMPKQLPAPSWRSLEELHFTPSVFVDRLNNQTDPKKERDQLIFRAGFSGVFTGNTIASTEVRLNAAYATDSGFDSRVDALELEWEPEAVFQGFLPIGVTRELIEGRLDHRWRFYGYIHWGEVKDKGRLELDEGDRFLRVGPFVGVDLIPHAWDKRLTLFGSWRYMSGVQGDFQASTHWQAGAAWQLDSVGNVSLEYKYEDGALPLVEEEVRSSTFGLGLKF